MELNFYGSTDSSRIVKEKSPEITPKLEEYRSEWRRDFARLVHSPSFRRLQGKTQLYPGIESDFFRNRLTHSIEVGQIAKSICEKFNSEEPNHPIDPQICEFAGFAHDLGHPPFGHQGEEALDQIMKDFGGFEGNAQTLRILSRLEKKIETECNNGLEYRVGLNLTARSLASILKYDNSIPLHNKDRENPDHVVKGYYKSEEEIVEFLKRAILGDKYKIFEARNQKQSFKTVECWIMDVADDIAYSTFDLEDGLKGDFYRLENILDPQDIVLESIVKKTEKALVKHFGKVDPIGLGEAKKILFELFLGLLPFKDTESFEDIKQLISQGRGYDEVVIYLNKFQNRFYHYSTSISQSGYNRTQLASKLIKFAMGKVKIEYDDEIPALSKVYLDLEARKTIELLKHFVFESQVLSSRLKVAEFRGKEIINEIFKNLRSDDGFMLMPPDCRSIYKTFNRTRDKMRVLCDFIAGMTDRYAIEFYGRLKSENPETIFKPF